MTLVLVALGAESDRAKRALRAFPAPRREEIAAVTDAARRTQKIVGEALLRLAAKECGRSEVTLARGEEGKPYFAELPEVCFNLSHAGDYVFCAFGSSPVGADIERVTPRDYHVVAARCFSAEEQKKIACSEAPLREFYRIWTVRESILKCRGKSVAHIRSAAVGGERVLSFGLTGGKLFPYAESGEAQYILSVCLSQGENPDLTVHVCPAEEVLEKFLR